MPKKRVSKAPEQRRAELIAAARHLFDRNGVDKTRVSDIVQSVGVAQGVFYYYFRSKDEIVEAVVDEISAELEAAVEAVFHDGYTGFAQKLAALLELYFGLIDQFTEDEALTLPYSWYGGAQGAMPEQRAREVLMTHMHRLVMEGVAAGEVKARYPSLTIQVMEAGLHWAASKELPTREMVYTIVEEALCLPLNSLVQYCGVTSPETG